MRIGIVLENCNPCRGGAEQWTWQFVSALVERRHEVHVIAKSFAPETLGMSITRHLVDDGGSRLGCGTACEETLRSLDLDLVHDMGVGWCGDVLQPHGGSWLSVSQRKHLLLPRWLRAGKRHVDQLLPRYREHSALLSRQFADYGQTVIALSEFVANDLRRLHGISDKRIRIVRNGVDTERFSPTHRARYRSEMRKMLGIDQRCVLALFVAQNFRLKGINVLLRCMTLLARQQSPLKLVVVGGKKLGHWRRKAARLGLRNAVSFVGPQPEPVPYYATADMLVHPTYYDPCSLVLLEAAASGLPLITTREFNGVAEKITDGLEGSLLSGPDEAEELAARMQAMADEKLRTKMGDAARQLALRYPFDRNVDELLDVYDECNWPRRRVFPITRGQIRLAS